MTATEEVLCLSGRPSLDLNSPLSFIPASSALFRMLIYGPHGDLSWQQRPACEENEDYLQIIPYVTVQLHPVLSWRENMPCVLGTSIVQARLGRILSYRRQGAEGRLTGLRSIGVGGHISRDTPDEPLPEDLIGRIYTAAYREICEELGLQLVARPGSVPAEKMRTLFSVQGMLVDQTTPVGRVHLGVAMSLNLPVMLSSETLYLLGHCRELPLDHAGLRKIFSDDSVEMRSAFEDLNYQHYPVFSEGRMPELGNPEFIFPISAVSYPRDEYEPWSQILLGQMPHQWKGA